LGDLFQRETLRDGYAAAFLERPARQHVQGGDESHPLAQVVAPGLELAFQAAQPDTDLEERVRPDHVLSLEDLTDLDGRRPSRDHDLMGAGTGTQEHETAHRSHNNDDRNSREEQPAYHVRGRRDSR
jgi:hypothetical protein